ncbi:tetratricopeptide repeat protein [Streptomyces flaveus]|uniref:tetratricopeptide repeat protein n=1 Tax=Streptomyces flaveus TaxID=66370 RepID=UPI001FE73E9B|nr:tetratricopeptide repeat protein [Streptomyces flaveus]
MPPSSPPPPLPGGPPTVGPPGPPASEWLTSYTPPADEPEDAVPPDPWRAAAAGLFNLSGLGLGYVLLRRWPLAALCWIATGWLLVAALPADPDGVPGGVIWAYGLVLMLAAVHGAWLGRRTRMTLPVRPMVAAGLGLVLLAVPAGSAVGYEAAREEAYQQMLLDRLAKTDRLVTAASRQGGFAEAKADYERALKAYRALGDDHPGSRAAERIPDRLDRYYDTVAAPYREKQYCEALEPLRYLWKLPDTMGKQRLGSLTDWPVEPLQTSLYECGITNLGGSDAATETKANGGELTELLRTFPDSESAAKVGPAVSAEIANQSKALKGNDPCPASEELQAISRTMVDLPAGSPGDGLRTDAVKAVESGAYACGVDEFEDDKFGAAATTLNDFADTYKDNKNAKRARQIAIAAEIAEERPEAGRKLPPSRSPGGAKMPLKISNDAPTAVEFLYTGPVTGRITLTACAGCTEYSSESQAADAACSNSGLSYPTDYLNLPAGDYHTLIKYADEDAGNVRNEADGMSIDPGYTYTNCTYIVRQSSLPGYPDIPLPDLPEIEPFEPAV